VEQAEQGILTKAMTAETELLHRDQVAVVVAEQGLRVGMHQPEQVVMA
jgi:hypothetical protein